jgi:hypothetical protein
MAYWEESWRDVGRRIGHRASRHLMTLVSAHHRLQNPDRNSKSKSKEEPEGFDQYRAKGKRKLADISCAHVAAAVT